MSAAAATSRVSISSRISSSSHPAPDAASRMPSATPASAPATRAGFALTATAPAAERSPYRWLLLDVAESSRTFLQAIVASNEAAAAAPSEQGRSADRSSSLLRTNGSGPSSVQQKHLSSITPTQAPTVGQLDKRLSLPFGGSITSNAPSSSKGPSKKPSFISRLRSGSNSMSSAASANSDKETASVDTAATTSQPPTPALTPEPLPSTTASPVSGQTAASKLEVAAFASTALDAREREAAATEAAMLLKHCGLLPADANAVKTAAARLDPKAVVELARKENIDAVYIGGGTSGTPGASTADASLTMAIVTKLLSGGSQLGVRAIALDPIATRTLTAQDASSLVAIAAQNDTLLAMPTKWGRDVQANARALVADCVQSAGGRSGEKRLFSPSFTWDETLAVLETLDEVRQTAPASQTLTSSTTTTATTTLGSSTGVRLPKVDDLSDTSMESASNVAASPRIGNEASDELTNASSAVLRAKLQEVQHILRQKNALIASLEQQARTGGNSGSSSARNGRSPSPGASLRSRRTSIGTVVDKNAASGSRPATPTRTRKNSSASVVDAAAGAPAGASTPRRGSVTAAGTAGTGGQSPGVRTRKNSRSSLVGEAQSPLSLSPAVSSVNQFDASGPTSPLLNSSGGGSLEPVRETRRNMDKALAAGLGGGGGESHSHRAPTVASENRRIASLTQQANGIANGASSGSGGGAAGAGGGSGKVILALTAELEETRLQLDLTRGRLRAAQLQASSLQRQHDDLKDSLARTRLENESNAQILARKDRQVSESLERARKAEHEAKELGRSSREWGTRVREVEAQLGSERILKAKAEAQYEALSASWKTTREKLQQDVVDLRKEVELRAIENRDEAQRLLNLKTQMEEAWKQRDMEKGALGDLLASLQQQQGNVEQMIKQSVGALVDRLEEFERQTTRQDKEVEYVGGELRRILRLMRSGGTDQYAA